jgi:hypothetical protein
MSFVLLKSLLLLSPSKADNSFEDPCKIECTTFLLWVAIKPSVRQFCHYSIGIKLTAMDLSEINWLQRVTILKHSEGGGEGEGGEGVL